MKGQEQEYDTLVLHKTAKIIGISKAFLELLAVVHTVESRLRVGSIVSQYLFRVTALL